MSSDISLPPSVAVLSLDPPEVELVFENVEERELKVEVPQLGSLPKSLVLVDIKLDPKAVRVKGPRSELKQLRSVETEPLDLRDIKESQSVTLALRKPGALSTLSIEAVSGKVEVERRPVERQFVSRQVELRTALDKRWIKLNPGEVTVVLAGEDEAVSAVRGAEVLPFAELKSVPLRTGEPIEVDVVAPGGTKVVRVIPPAVTVWYEGPSKASARSAPPKRR